MTNLSLSKITKSKKLTGEEVGKIYLREFARSVKALQEGEFPPKGKFSDAEKQAMGDGLQGYDIKKYNTYIKTLRFLRMVSLLYQEQAQQLKYLFPWLLSQIDDVENSKTIKLLMGSAPLIFTQKQYDQLKKSDLDKKLAKNTSVIGMILSVVDYYLTLYLSNKLKASSGPITPYDALFEAYKNKPLTNKSHIKNYWQEGANGHYETPEGKNSKNTPLEEWKKEILKWIEIEIETGEKQIKWVDDGRQAPPDATKYSILEYLSGYFNLGEDTNKEDLEIFKSEYPDIYEKALAELKNIKGLGIEKIKLEDYDKPLISYKTLHKLKLKYYEQFFKFIPRDGHLTAIIPDEQMSRVSDFYLDANGYYKYELDDYETRSYKEFLPTLIKKTKSHLRIFYALKETYKLLGEQLGEKCVLELATEPKEQLSVAKLVNIANGKLEDLKGMMRKSSLVLSQEVVDKIHQDIAAIKPFNIKELKPSPKNVELAKEYCQSTKLDEDEVVELQEILLGEQST